MNPPIRAGIIGTGFIGTVHARAIAAAGGTLTRVADGTPQGAANAAVRLRARGASASAEELISSDEIDVVHICTPNVLHAELAETAIRHGKHVICEKPLATSEEDARLITQLADEAGVVAVVPFAYRYHPMVREVRARIAQGDAGNLRVLHGSYLQDWLADRAATNWRVDSALGGASRAFADIGVHWCDLMEFTTGHRIIRLVTQLTTAHRQRGGDDSTGTVDTEDGANVLFETDCGAVGSLVVSQVALGRKNRLWFSFDGEHAAYVFDQEEPESLWVGGAQESRVISRGPLLSDDASRYSFLPPGHPQGFQECFNAFVGDAYSAIGGDSPSGLPTFADGLRASILTAAVLESSRTQGWVKVAP